MKMKNECPICTSKQRILDSMKSWNWAAMHYFKPDEFRRNLNGLIQESRNATFVLQSNKSKIKGFDEWYKSWQNHMSSDTALQWLKNSRNMIVKVKDLETRSSFLGKVVYGWLEEDEIVFDLKVTTPESVAIPVILEKIKHFELPEGSFISLERSWQAENFHQAEILKTCAHGIVFLSQLAIDAHRRFDLQCDRFEMFEKASKQFSSQAENFEDDRKLWYKIEDRKVVKYAFKEFNAASDSETKAEILDRASCLKLADCTIGDPIEKAIFYAQSMSQVNFSRDGFVATILIAGKDDEVLIQIPLMPSDRTEKHIHFRRAAEKIAYSNINWAVLIGEAWTSDGPQKNGHAANAIDRKEIVAVSGIDPNGRQRYCIAKIERFEGGQSLKAFEDYPSGGMNNVMNVFYRAMTRFKKQ